MQELLNEDISNKTTFKQKTEVTNRKKRKLEEKDWKIMKLKQIIEYSKRYGIKRSCHDYCHECDEVKPDMFSCAIHKICTKCCGNEYGVLNCSHYE